MSVTAIPYHAPAALPYPPACFVPPPCGPRVPQAFNLNPDTRSSPQQQYTPASAFLVGDHLSRILVRNLMPRMRAPPPEQAATRPSFAAARGGPSRGRAAPAQAALNAAGPSDAVVRQRFAQAVHEMHTTIFHG